MMAEYNMKHLKHMSFIHYNEISIKFIKEMLDGKYFLF